MAEAYRQRAEEVLKELGTDGERGLSGERAAANRAAYGENAFRREKPVSLARRIFDAAREPMIVMLIAAALVTLGINVSRHFAGAETDFLESAGICGAILLSVLITVAMEGRSAKAFEALSRISDDVLVKVLRDGEARLIPQREVVVGDVLIVATGDKLPADARLLRSAALRTDESALTGESAPVRKDASAVFESGETPVAERSNMLYAGTYVTAGSGVAVVTAVGEGTEFGKIARALSSTVRSSTPLQEKMGQLGKRIAVVGVGSAAVVFLVQLVTAAARQALTFEVVAEAFITAIVLIVATVPEGLPTIVAVSLSINVIKMSRRNALVKKMAACETVGGVNVICSDKTGTLTENRMTVTDVCTEAETRRPDALEIARDGALLRNFCVNGTAEVYFEEGGPRFVGNPTECALLVAAGKSGIAYGELRAQSRIAHVYPFSSEEKRMTTVVAEGGGLCAYAKGSPEKILAMCDVPPSLRAEIEARIASFQEDAARVIAFAHRPFEKAIDFEAERAKIERDMCFDGFVAIADPVHADVPQAIARCREAGIDVKMLTGDNIVTARAIARQLQLLDDRHVTVEASAVEAMSDDELAQKLGSIRVIARSTPAVKMRVVDALKRRGDVVAVTGDGINDAPALKNADVGIAMGISGTEVSKEASDIVLLDDSFSTIARAIQWGRVIYENFQRFLQFQLTVNLSSVVVVLASVLSGFGSPFSALQLLWINIVMDGPPALTLGLEPARGDLMRRRPVRRDANIVTGEMLFRIAANSLFISAVFLAQRFFNFLGAADAEAPTVLFTLFVLLQLFNAFNCRELTSRSIFGNIADNRPMLLVSLATFCLQVLITQHGGALYDTVPLSLATWLKIVPAALSVIIASETFRFAARLCESAAAAVAGKTTRYEPKRPLLDD